MRRDIIRKDILIDGMTYQQFCKRINKAKHLMINNGAEKGQILNIQIPQNHGNNLAFIFAGMELGMPIMICPDDIFNPMKSEEYHDSNYDKLQKKNRFICDFRIDGMGDTAPTHQKIFYRYNDFQQLAKDRCINVDVGLVEDMPDTHIQPWHVTSSNDALSVLDDDFNPTSFTFAEVKKKQTFTRDDIVAFGMSHHHENYFINGFLPAVTTAKEMISFNVPPIKIYGDIVKLYIANSLKQIIKKRVTAMYCLEPLPMESLFEFMGERDWDFRETVRIVVQKHYPRTDFHDYWEAEKNIIFDFSA